VSTFAGQTAEGFEVVEHHDLDRYLIWEEGHWCGRGKALWNVVFGGDWSERRDGVGQREEQAAEGVSGS
jgi:hypothetical protein